MSIFKADDIFSDGMILQRDAENFITGDGEGEITMTLERDDRICGRSRIAADGRWRIAVPAGKADCLPYTVNIRCGSTMIVISDVLFGDVFHITGQSNMELPLNRTYDPFEGPVPMPTEELIREYRVPIELCFEAGKESCKFVGGSWVRACDDKDLNFSAAGYYFAKKLFAEIGVRNEEGCTAYPWDFHDRPEKPLDEQEQSDFYESAMAATWDIPWFCGYFWWDWKAVLPSEEKAKENRDFTVYGKLAEQTLKKWYTSK